MRGSRITTKVERDALARAIQGRMGSFETRTLGGRCPTPGLRIRSRGRGRGLGVGRGYGPRGRIGWDW